MLWLIWVLWVTRWSLNGSDLFQCITWIPDLIEIWGVLGPDLHFELFVMFFEPFQNVQLGEATAIRECSCHEGVYCSGVYGRWVVCVKK